MSEPRNRTFSCKVTKKMAEDIAHVAAATGRSVSEWIHDVMREDLYGCIGKYRAFVAPAVVPAVPSARGGAMKPNERRDAFNRMDGRCAYCDIALDPFAFHVDHIVPVSKGGTRDPENLTAACPSCNSRKRAMDVSVFKARRTA